MQEAPKLIPREGVICWLLSLTPITDYNR